AAERVRRSAAALSATAEAAADPFGAWADPGREDTADALRHTLRAVAVATVTVAQRLDDSARKLHAAAELYERAGDIAAGLGRRA
ncbi:MAG: hypothetical protein M3Q27_01610, partial [Actinomycetota bacterium]|nr:hypothetical protein [Actinomycetota bacterium]